jgi:hypothetical protein
MAVWEKLALKKNVREKIPLTFQFTFGARNGTRSWIAPGKSNTWAISFLNWNSIGNYPTNVEDEDTAMASYIHPYLGNANWLCSRFTYCLVNMNTSTAHVTDNQFMKIGLIKEDGVSNGDTAGTSNSILRLSEATIEDNPFSANTVHLGYSSPPNLLANWTFGIYDKLLFWFAHNFNNGASVNNFKLTITLELQRATETVTIN